MISKRDRVLIVARQMRQRFTAEGLVVAVWRAHPDLFGMKGYESMYPDTNAVLAYLYGVKGLVKEGKIRKVQTKVFECAPEPHLEIA